MNLQYVSRQPVKGPSLWLSVTPEDEARMRRHPGQDMIYSIPEVIPHRSVGSGRIMSISNMSYRNFPARLLQNEHER
ncbi:uncharacterized protein FFUJ_12165 [Fusarium fujikuroi IMI 58289]|uniref:Uncharacterized protein n=1 Tax=Gibberella fujikuroi (strain CBS 195.34 / IMI 58289 / NRRL A-6831) TaxID=1279085 RepID=S0EEK2_GIBF5|nr:uncharacterized protein FFUJ_12165 [Fusarium fujikuroi IMI 58289]KLO84918.1 uncharacterized protein Y057_3813 [Fusarium fujikuroi]KLO90429.1 uncharacterized protein LW93_5894 [Fusarium fujikuroi]KLP16879.1 uncharacterized protein LW94_325 [Fusarium fujikuroi]CCT73075.1 uncharacterized protein FFUJ_12165 [Fusarium fujikuroi IMI 58289]SCO11784.1 uncharacterized protein FFC1_11590 [Fusarium fujikuroi]